MLIRNRKMTNEGQSTIEFLTAFIFVFGLLFLFIKIAINTSAGYMVHYGIFMASRTYLVHDSNSNTEATTDRRAEVAAQKVFDEIMVQAGLPKIALEFNAPTFGGNKALVGVRTRFKQKFSFTKLIGGAKILNMVSESFLGREPPRAECLNRACDATGVIALSNTCDLGDKTYSTLFDNGC